MATLRAAAAASDTAAPGSSMHSGGGSSREVPDVPEDDTLILEEKQITAIVPSLPRPSVKDVLRDRTPFLERESPIPCTVFLKYREQVDNHAIAEITRVESEDLLRLKDDNAARWAAHGRELAHQRAERRERNRQLQQLLQQRNETNVRAMREREAEWQTVREKRQEEHEQELRELVLAGAALQVKMAATEEKMQEQHRDLARQHREQVTQEVARAREEKIATNKRLVAQVRAPSGQPTPDQLAARAMRRARGVKEETRQWKTERERRDEEYLERARANRQRALATRASAKKSMEESQNKRKQAAAKERGNDHLVVDTKVRLINSNRREVANIYKQRFASAQAAEEWESSPLKRLHAAAAYLVGLQKQHGSSTDNGASVSL